MPALADALHMYRVQEVVVFTTYQKCRIYLSGTMIAVYVCHVCAVLCLRARMA